MSDGGLDLVVHGVIHAQMTIGTDEQVTVVERHHAIGNEILEMTRHKGKHKHQQIRSHFYHSLGDVVNHGKSFIEDCDDGLRRNGRVAGVVGPQKSIVVIELNTLEAGHGGGGRIICAE